MQTCHCTIVKHKHSWRRFLSYMCTHPPSFLKQLKVAVPTMCFESHFPLLLPTIIHKLLPMHFQVTHPPKDGYWANLKTLHMSYGLRPTKRVTLIYLTNPTSHIHCNCSHLPLIYLAHKDCYLLINLKFCCQYS